MGVPSTIATGGVAGLSVAAGATAACCPLPQAASRMVIAATVHTWVHCVLKNWVIWILYTRKKAALADMADAPGGRSLAFTARSLQFSSIRRRILAGGRRRRRLDGQCVNVGFQQVVDGGVHQAVTRQRGYPAERLGHDGYAEMTLASGRPGMAGVHVALILDDQEGWGETRLQTAAQSLFTGGRCVAHTLLWSCMVLVL